MGFHVGMPTLELKQTKGAAAKNGKRFGDGRSICVEAGEERYSKTENFDPSRSDLNVHLGRFSGGDDAWDYVKKRVAEAEEIRRAKGKRGYRKDATVAYALIVKPEGEWANAQTPETLDKFFNDAASVLDDLGIVKKDETVLRERHWDEGISAEEPCVHEHYVFMAHDAEGDLVGSRHLRLKEFTKLNKDFPRIMREKYGWECEELTDYDAEKTKSMTPEEKAEYNAEHIAKKKAKRHGLSANEYAAEKRAKKAEKRAKEAVAIAAEAEDKLREVTAERDAEMAAKNAAITERKLVENRLATAKREIAAAEPQLKQTRAAIASAQADQKKAEKGRDAAQRELDEIEPKITQKKAEKATADKAAADAEAKKKKAEEDRDKALLEKQASFDERVAEGRKLMEARALTEKRKKELDEIDEELAAKARETNERFALAEKKLIAANNLSKAAQTALDEAEAQRQKDDDILSRFERYCDDRFGENPKLETVVKLVHDAVRFFREAESKNDKAEKTREDVRTYQGSINRQLNSLPRYRQRGNSDDFGVR